MDSKRWFITGILIAATLLIAPSAHAYPEESYPPGQPEKLATVPQLTDYFLDPDNPTQAEIDAIPCISCHGTQEASEPSGPHGGYSATSAKCATCHSVHDAPSTGILLLPAVTVLSTCQTCHDGTGGTGVYGVIFRRTNQEPASAHRMLDEVTDPIQAIPGGSSDGTTRTVDFSGAGGGFTCTDCHSPHGSDVVEAFTGDRARSATDTAGVTNVIESARLLKQQPTGGLVRIGSYGSDWCGSCHAGRLSGHAGGELLPNNHPVDSEVTQPDPADPFVYDHVVYSDDTTGTLGRTNRGYVMPDHPLNSRQVGHGPICQQCHEDARSVGDDLANYPGDISPTLNEEFRVTDVDGSAVGDNPRFQVFPHESTNRRLLLEEESDLCLNCHAHAGQ